MRRALEAVLTEVESIPPKAIAVFLGELETIRIAAFARMISLQPSLPPDKSLTVKQAHKRLGVSEAYLYHHWKEFDFARQEGRKVLFSSNGIDQHLKKSR